MTDTLSPTEQIDAFEQHYDYDASYMHDLLEKSPAAFQVFAECKRINSFRQALPAEAYYVAAVSVMEIEDCGPCYDLNLKMAREEGVAEAVLSSLVESPERLPAILQDVRAHALAVSNRQQPDQAIAERLIAHYGPEPFGELALAVATVRIYPSLKRALLKAGSCSLKQRR